MTIHGLTGSNVGRCCWCLALISFMGLVYPFLSCFRCWLLKISPVLPFSLLMLPEFYFFFGHMQDDLSSLTRESNSHSLQWKCGMSTSGPPGKSLTCAFFSGELLLTDSCYQDHRCLGSYRSFWGQPLANDLQMCDYHKPVSLSLGGIDSVVQLHSRASCVMGLRLERS